MGNSNKVHHLKQSLPSHKSVKKRIREEVPNENIDLEKLNPALFVQIEKADKHIQQVRRERFRSKSK